MLNIETGIAIQLTGSLVDDEEQTDRLTDLLFVLGGLNATIIIDASELEITPGGLQMWCALTDMVENNTLIYEPGALGELLQEMGDQYPHKHSVFLNQDVGL